MAEAGITRVSVPLTRAEYRQVVLASREARRSMSALARTALLRAMQNAEIWSEVVEQTAVTVPGRHPKLEDDQLTVDTDTDAKAILAAVAAVGAEALAPLNSREPVYRQVAQRMLDELQQKQSSEGN